MKKLFFLSSILVLFLQQLINHRLMLLYKNKLIAKFIILLACFVRKTDSGFEILGEFGELFLTWVFDLEKKDFLYFCGILN